MTRRELRIKRFATFASNLSLYTQRQNEFLCPFCNEFFQEEHIDRKVDQPKSNFLVGAHVVPFTVSHTMRTTMCCFKCDNWFGTWFNSHESRRHAIRKHQAKGYQTRIYTKMAEKGREFGVETLLKWSKEPAPEVSFCYQFPLETESKTWFEDNTESRIIRSSWDGKEIGVDYYGRYNTRRANLSYWHSLYLHMFHHYGYEWAYSEWAVKILRQFQYAEFPVIPEDFIEPILISSDLLSEYVLRRRQPSTHYDPTQDGFFVVFPHFVPLSGHVALFVPRNWSQSPHREPLSLSHDITPDHKKLSQFKHLLPFDL